MIYGPGQYAANGDAFSTRCTSQFNCSSVQNAHYRAVNDPNRGYWYVVQVPAGVSGSIDINVFDALLQPRRGHQDHGLRPRGPARPDFETEFKVYKQTNPLDFTVRIERVHLGSGSNNAADGGCWWQLRKESGFFRCVEQALHDHAACSPATPTWSTCAPTPSAPPTRRATTATPSRPCSTATATPDPGPSIYAYADMGIANQNNCPSGTCDGTFYLAKVGPQFAGRDAGDRDVRRRRQHRRGHVDRVSDEALADGRRSLR